MRTACAGCCGAAGRIAVAVLHLSTCTIVVDDERGVAVAVCDVKLRMPLDEMLCDLLQDQGTDGINRLSCKWGREAEE